MPVLVREMTPVQAPTGKLIHITSLGTPNRTACGKVCRRWRVRGLKESSERRGGWRLTRRQVTCEICRDSIGVAGGSK